MRLIGVVIYEFHILSYGVKCYNNFAAIYLANSTEKSF